MLKEKFIRLLIQQKIGLVTKHDLKKYAYNYIFGLVTKHDLKKYAYNYILRYEILDNIIDINRRPV